MNYMKKFTASYSSVRDNFAIINIDENHKCKDTYYGLYCSGTGLLHAMVNTYAQYENLNNNAVISKGTLNNVLTEKIGDIGTILDSINGESL